MKSYFTYLFVTVSLLFFISFTVGNKKNAALRIQDDWRENISNFQQKLQALNLKWKHEKITTQDFQTLKNAYKLTETYTSYFYPSIDKSLNGAPLNTVITDVIISDVEKPTGLQVLEEQLFTEGSNPEEIQNSFDKISQYSIDLIQHANTIKFQDRHIFEANRQEIIRLQTMGISGFDSPVIGNSLPGTVIAISQMEIDLNRYFIFATNQNSQAGFKLDSIFSESNKFLSTNTDFDSFDRAAYVRSYLDPIYAQILQLHLDSQIETYDLVSNLPQKVNYFVSSVFDSKFLNPYAYNKLGEEQPSSEIAEIGKLLFFDPILSANNQRACASCHKPNLAFADGYVGSINFDKNGSLKRNSPGLLNASTQDAFFWDGRSTNLNDQIDHVALNPDEFNSSVSEVVLKLRNSQEYLNLFSQAYGRKITATDLGIFDVKSALSQYLKTLNSYNSEFDKYMRNEPNTLSESAVNGYNLFMGKATCGTCHFPPTFYGLVPPLYSDSEFEVIGIPATAQNQQLDSDLGRFKIFPYSFYRGSFKTPTVRNVTLTAPYMHNGVYNTLEEVVDFYNNGGGNGIGFEIEQTLPSDSLHLTDQEKNDLITFMQSLTDTANTTHIPIQLPLMDSDSLNHRKIGGVY